MNRTFLEKAENFLGTVIRAISVIGLLVTGMILVSFAVNHEKASLTATALVVGAFIGFLQVISQLFKFGPRRCSNVLPVQGVGAWRNQQDNSLS